MKKNIMNPREFPSLMLGAALLALFPLSLRAQDNFFNNVTPASDYATPGNWSLGTVPAGTNNIVIGTSGNSIRSAVYSSATNYSTTGRIILGIFSPNNGSLTMDAGSGTLTYGGNAGASSNFIGVDAGTGSLTMNGGTFRVNGSEGTTGYLRIGANTGTGTVTVNAGLLDIGHSANLGARFDNSNGTAATSSGSLTVSGTGQVVVGSGSNSTTSGGNNGYLYLKNDHVDSTGNAIVNLNGGTLTAKRIVAGTGGGTKTVNFNGGTLRAGASDANFLDAASGFTANVNNGGAVFDTQAFNITVGAALVADGTGGLTKSGAGALTLSGINTYVGDSVINVGTLNLSNGGESRFKIGNSNLSNGFDGSGTVNFDGLFRLDTSTLTDTTGTWNLVNVGSLTETFGGTFGLAFVGGPSFTHTGGGNYSSGNFSFSTSTGDLVLIPEPGTLALLVISGAAVLLFRRRK